MPVTVESTLTCAKLLASTTPASVAFSTAVVNSHSMPFSPSRWRHLVSEVGTTGDSCWKCVSPQNTGNTGSLPIAVLVAHPTALPCASASVSPPLGDLNSPSGHGHCCAVRPSAARTAPMASYPPCASAGVCHRWTQRAQGPYHRTACSAYAVTPDRL